MKLKVKISKEAYEVLYYLANTYKCSIDEVIEMALADFFLKNIGINIIVDESMQDSKIRVTMNEENIR